MQENKPAALSKSTAAPKPVFIRMLMLFGGGVGCLLVGVIVSLVTGDVIMLAMSAFLALLL